jgi:hypothetical protein
MRDATHSSCRPIVAAFALLLGSLPLSAQDAPPKPLVDQPIAAYRLDLLHLAFEAVSAMPTQPHAKNRARAQETVVAACLGLDQPKLAQELAARIDDWRRGICLADLALYCLEHGRIDAVPPLLEAADRIAEQAKSDTQSWHRDRIRARIGQAHLRLGRHQQANEYVSGVAPADLGTFDSAAARLADPVDFAAQVKAIDTVIAAGNFEPIRNVLQVCVDLYDRYHDDEERRAQVETRALNGYDRLPVAVRLDLIAQLVDVALRHEDVASAKRFLDQADKLLEHPAMPVEDELATRARFAKLRGKVGEPAKGRTAAGAAVARFYGERDRIVDIDRGIALRPLAAAFAELGDKAEAKRVFLAAIEEGLHNPNSRPRAEDLAAVCVAMATSGFEPDAELRARLDQIKKGLGNPW